MIDQMNLLLRMVIAHLLADFLFQTKASIKHRTEKRWGSHWLYLHAFIYSLLIYSASSQVLAFWIVPVVFVSHVIIDGLKTGFDNNIKFFLIDQLCHLIIILVIWVALSRENADFIASSFQSVWNSKTVLLITLGYVIVLWPSGYFLRYLLKPFHENLKEQENRGLEKAGLWIGLAERFLTYSFMLSGYMEAIGFLAAAKSVFRFGEIKDPKNREEAEYILIGSLLSFGLAILTGYIIRNILP